MKKYIVYKVTNRFDDKFYIGVHATKNVNDKYMGSGVEIKEALKKYGRKSFVKEILHIFDAREEMLTKEKELVTREFCMREDTYNIIEGGGSYSTLDMTCVVDTDGNTSLVYVNDPRFLSGELKSFHKNKLAVKDKEGRTSYVSKDDPRFISGELVPVAKGTFLVKDKNGNQYRISKDDPRYISGEFVGFRKGIPQHKNNSHLGIRWINNGIENKRIRVEELEDYLKNGWVKNKVKKK